jgi:NADP-dependent 3-hydroxy acid dehydrogenase YdfG
MVTGAGSGIGRAIALALAGQGSCVRAVGRRASQLEETAAHSSLIHSAPADVADDSACRSLFEELDRLDILVHSAGTISLGRYEETSADEFDRLYRTNLRAPFVLTQAALPLLRRSKGQIVFINSTAGVSAGPGTSLYSATKHGLKALADSLRDEVNPDEIRVISIFPGRTATPMQAQIMETEGKCWHPDVLMQPSDIAELVMAALLVPRTAEVTNLFLRPFHRS